MNITYYTKDVYGQELRYPVSNEALMVCRLTGTKTLTDWALAVLRDNDATVTEVIRPR
jgi:hypothetical protein